uniref:Uncharacterized protein n=1 Tax=Prorocentrum micans TaxID=2945 RepID=A0A7S2TB63_PROMC|mmetsp:Transcript_11182/g.8721  ORF Transcript_11182/g.8721 Transcript_11182/m.8721 type:complete len:144 (+) Transcript_11182:49-480(+)
MDDGVLLFDKESEDASAFAVNAWCLLRSWLGVSFREPAPKERAGFDVKPPNTVVVVTPNVFSNEQVIEAFDQAVTLKRNIVFLHHIRSGCDLMEEVEKKKKKKKTLSCRYVARSVAILAQATRLKIAAPLVVSAITRKPDNIK